LLHALDERLVQMRQVGPPNPGRGVDIGDPARLDRARGELPQVQRDIGRNRQAARALRSSASNLATQTRTSSKNAMSSW
jgi:hypothetical protein